MICHSRSQKLVGDAQFCQSCVTLQRDREGCPRIVNFTAAHRDQFYNRQTVAPSNSNSNRLTSV